MYLSVTLKKDNDSKSFIEEVLNTILEDSKSATPKFKTWESKILTNELSNAWKHHILKQTDKQLEKLGSLFLHASEQYNVKISFNIASDCNPDEDQIVIYFARCAAMLRNHFGFWIESVSLVDL